MFTPDIKKREREGPLIVLLLWNERLDETPLLGLVVIAVVVLAVRRLRSHWRQVCRVIAWRLGADNP